MASRKIIGNSSSDNETQFEKIVRSQACRSDPTAPSQDDVKGEEGGRKRINENPASPSGTVPKRSKNITHPSGCSPVIEQDKDIPQPLNLIVKDDFRPSRLNELLSLKELLSSDHELDVELDDELDDELSLDMIYQRSFVSSYEMIEAQKLTIASNRQSIEQLEKDIKEWRKTISSAKSESAAILEEMITYVEESLTSDKEYALELEDFLRDSLADLAEDEKSYAREIKRIGADVEERLAAVKEKANIIISQQSKSN